MECDVLVVGAGHAGLSAAINCAKGGLKTIIVEKNRGIGHSVKTSGHTWIDDVIHKFDISNNAISQVINSLYLHSISLGEGVEVRWGKNVLCTLNHSIFFQELALRAINNGVKILLPTEVTDVILGKNDQVSGVVAKTINDKKIEIKSKLVIDASGKSAVIAKKVGLSNFDKKEIGLGIEYEMANVKLKNPNRIEYYTGYDVIPVSYAWIAPKGKNKAIVGMATVINSPTREYEKFKEKTGKDIYDCFENLLNNHPVTSRILKDAQPVEFHSGYSPLSGMYERSYTDGLLVVGDAAGQANPLLGEGIRFALIFGEYAAQTACKSIKSNDFSENALSEYQENVKKFLGESYRSAFESLNIETDEFWNTLIYELRELIKQGKLEDTIKILKNEI